MKFLVFGINGWIGGMFKTILDNKNIEYVSADCRAENVEQVNDLILRTSPTHIISFIGRTNGVHNGKTFTTIDYLEQKGRVFENVRDNLFSPIVLAILSKKHNIHFTYLGTGCIFSYDTEHTQENGFTEDDKPNFFGSSYSTVKGFTDQLMHMFDNVLNLRIRMPISGDVNPRNFITKITTYEKICSIPNSMTVLDELLPLALDMMIQQKTGTINLTNPGVISHNEILEMYREIVDPQFQWKNFSLEEQAKILAADRSNNFLDTTKLEELYPNVLSIKDSVRQTLYEIKKHTLTNILVTGGCGFIGSNFINIMHDRYPNLKFINIDAIHYCADVNNVKEHIRLGDRYKLIIGDIQDHDIYKIMKDNRVKYVVHFAAMSHVDGSFKYPQSYIDNNIKATLHMLDAAKNYDKLAKFIHISTDEVYGDYTEEHVNESAMTHPTNPYSASKLGAEAMATAYYYSFKVPVIITRGNNVFGPNQYHEKVVPKFIKMLKDDKKCTIHGAGSVERTFIYVDDVVNALDRLIERGQIGEIYNIGSENKISVLNLTKLLVTKIKDESPSEWIEYVEDRVYNDKHYNINYDKIMKLDWEPKISLNEGIDKCIEFY